MLLTPSYLIPNVFALTDAFLEQNGIRGLIFDIDNTLVGYQTPHPTQEVQALLTRLAERGIRLAIVSNNKRSRVELFAKDLGIPAYYRSAKPFRFVLNRVRRRFDLPAGQIALVGDQIFTDVLGGNRAGMITILVDPIDRKETVFFRFKRRLEEPIIARKRREDERK
ncbi:MAG: YqeG family HAD IIIA-type phosphatase [Clostridiales bacterium]|nr:MAG: YqeG family HAD IIIA-type phosphatase [Clostridiales bacterium]